MRLPDFSSMPIGVPQDAFPLDEIIQQILANVRDGSIDEVYKSAINWCSLNRSHRSACEQNGDHWEVLCYNIFPNWKQEVLPPMGDTGLQNIMTLYNFPLTPEELPWSGEPEATPWKEWFIVLCKHYMKGRRDLREAVSTSKMTRDSKLSSIEYNLKKLEDFTLRWAASLEAVPPNQKKMRQKSQMVGAVEAACLSWRQAILSLEQNRGKLLEYERTYGNNNDDKERNERPSYNEQAPLEQTRLTVEREERETSMDIERVYTIFNDYAPSNDYKGYRAHLEQDKASLVNADENMQNVWNTYNYQEDDPTYLPTPKDIFLFN